MTACHLCAAPLDDDDPMTALLDHVRTEHPSEFAEVVAQMFESVNRDAWLNSRDSDDGKRRIIKIARPNGTRTISVRKKPLELIYPEGVDEPEDFGGCSE